MIEIDPTRDFIDLAEVSEKIFFKNQTPIPYLKDVVTFSHLFLMKYEDFPRKFIVSGPHDPRLASSQFLQEAADFVSDFFFQERKELSSTDDEMFRSFLLFIRDPYLSEEGKNFTLFHEVAHIHLGHYLDRFKLRNFEIFSMAVATAFSSYLYSPSLGASLGVFALAIGTIKIGELFLKPLHSRVKEKAADLWAIKHGGSIEGGSTLLTA